MRLILSSELRFIWACQIFEVEHGVTSLEAVFLFGYFFGFIFVAGCLLTGGKNAFQGQDVGGAWRRIVSGASR